MKKNLPYKSRSHQVLLAMILLMLISCKQKQVIDEQITRRVQDHGGLLTQNEEDSLTFLSESLEESIGSQLAIVTVDSLHGEPIESFSLRTARSMGLGRKDFNDGLLITVSRREKKMRIEVGTGLELIISDAEASRIIREVMVPRFRQDQYFLGLAAGTRTIITMIREKRELVGKSP